MQKLEERWWQAFGAYETLRNRCERQAVRWEWADGERYDPRPLYFERSKLRRGRLVGVPAGDLSGLWQYGFDAADRVVIGRGYPARALHVDQCLEEFTLHGERLTEAIRFAQYQPKIPIRVAHSVTTNGGPVGFQMFAIDVGPILGDMTPDQALAQASAQGSIARYQEMYIYEDDRLARIKVLHDWGGGQPFSHEEALHYDKMGRVTDIEGHYADGSPQTIYHRPEQNYGVGTMLGRIYQRLLEIIPQRLAQARVQERVYCLALVYDGQSTLPALVLGLESVRSAILKQSAGTSLKHALWQPAEPCFALEDAQTAGDRALLEQQLELSGDDTPVREMLRDLAAALGECRWKGVLNTTKDFVVFAADYDQDEPLEALSASVPAKQVAQFHRRGWL